MLELTDVLVEQSAIMNQADHFVEFHKSVQKSLGLEDWVEFDRYLALWAGCVVKGQSFSYYALNVLPGRDSSSKRDLLSYDFLL